MRSVNAAMASFASFKSFSSTPFSFLNDSATSSRSKVNFSIADSLSSSSLFHLATSLACVFTSSSLSTSNALIFVSISHLMFSTAFMCSSIFSFNNCSSFIVSSFNSCVSTFKAFKAFCKSLDFFSSVSKRSFVFNTISSLSETANPLFSATSSACFNAFFNFVVISSSCFFKLSISLRLVSSLSSNVLFSLCNSSLISFFSCSSLNNSSSRISFSLLKSSVNISTCRFNSSLCSLDSNLSSPRLCSAIFARVNIRSFSNRSWSFAFCMRVISLIDDDKCSIGSKLI
mmetsp:Transcript_826/g.2404  ORF Transcript_826/g.2404 Transcript_826/m.2404 type:complete len:287 (-) Transcript_826:340-1200(-)